MYAYINPIAMFRSGPKYPDKLKWHRLLAEDTAVLHLPDTGGIRWIIGDRKNPLQAEGIIISIFGDPAGRSFGVFSARLLPINTDIHIFPCKSRMATSFNALLNESF